MNFDAAAGDYYKKANDEVLVVLQTESPTESRQRGRDLPAARLSMRSSSARTICRPRCVALMESDPTPAEHEAMLQRILAAGKRAGTPVGLHVQNPDDVKKRIAEGWQFLAPRQRHPHDGRLRPVVG